MSHPDRDHITGLAEILHRYQIAGWLDSGSESDDPLYEECQKQLQAAAIPKYAARTGLKLDLGEGITLEVLYPPPAQ